MNSMFDGGRGPIDVREVTARKSLVMAEWQKLPRRARRRSLRRVEKVKVGRE